MLKELEDYIWFPVILRKWQMEYIGYAVVLFKLYAQLVQVLDKMIAENNTAVLQDTCSGSGAPAVYVYNRLSRKPPMMLTDKFPYARFKHGPLMIYAAFKADIIRLHPSPGTLFTMYNAFHHFDSDTQIGLVKKLAENNNPFLIAEIIQPGPLSLIKVLFTTIILQLFIAPFVNPFSLKRLFFTYIIPVNLFTITYDGIISVLRSKTAGQYQNLLQTLSTHSYQITVNKAATMTGTIVYIKGEPVIK